MDYLTLKSANDLKEKINRLESINNSLFSSGDRATLLTPGARVEKHGLNYDEVVEIHRMIQYHLEKYKEEFIAL